MSKRAPGYARREKDFYPTPAAAVRPLIPHLPAGVRYVEPCAGDGRLVRHLARHGMVCVGAIDIEPRHDFITAGDALELTDLDLADATLLITNPPYERQAMHAMIERFRRLRPTWLLLESDWLMTLQAEPFLAFASDIVAIGRVQKIDGTDNGGYDNHVWVRFQAMPTVTRFHARSAVLKIPYDTEAAMKTQDLPTGRTSIRLPPELRAHLDEEARRREMTITELVVEALTRDREQPKRSDFFD